MATMLAATLLFAAWAAATLLLVVLFFGWTNSLFVSVPAAVCITTVAALLLARPARR